MKYGDREYEFMVSVCGFKFKLGDMVDYKGGVYYIIGFSADSIYGPRLILCDNEKPVRDSYIVNVFEDNMDDVIPIKTPIK